ncbi:MAG: AraC family transcriptional regulator [Kiritimatiellae bacterium]|nr:AraC family transcriptional regulator [Kiritimatiellia bacterium]MDW8457731.1 AraC family transcriptional regulator [Verrucomicrobiota bacterium]
MNSRNPPDRLSRYFSSQVSEARRFHFRPAARSRNGLRVVGGGYERCAPDYAIERPGFPHPVLEFVAEGSGRLVIHGTTHRLGPGSVFAYGPGIAHRIECDPLHPMGKYFIVLGGRGAAAALRAARLPPGTAAAVGRPERIRQILDDLIDFALSNRRDRDACCAEALRYALMKLPDLLVNGSGGRERAFFSYMRCRRFLEEKGGAIRSLREAAAACHVDPAYMCRLFQRFGGERPSHYLQHIRMNRAMTLLQTTDLLVKEIAEILGFEDPANFTRAFRSWFGTPPAAVRRGS